MALGDQTRLAGLAVSHLWQSGHLKVHTSRFYRWRYSGNVPNRLLLAPKDIRTADPIIASEIYSGIFSFTGHTVQCQGASPFQAIPPAASWQKELHGFGWLRHLHAAQTDLLSQHARALVDEWITLCGGYDPAAWQPDIVARRLISWLSHAPLLLEGATGNFYRRFLRSLTRQARFLNVTAPYSDDGPIRLTAAIALTMAGLTMANRDRLLSRSVKWLEEELQTQILPDGGHICRNPECIVEQLLDLLPLNQTFTGRDMASPAGLVGAIDRMMPMLRFFRLGDGGLARFNGASATASDAIATLLAYDETRGKPLSNARFSGYVRLEAGAAVLIADSGKTPPLHASAIAHAGALSFELSDAAQLIVVNCGSPIHRAGEWRDVCRATAAHSTAVLNDTSSSRMIGPGWFRKNVGALILSGPSGREAEIEEGDNGVTATLSHDGYVDAFGVLHRRRLSLSADGLVLQGEDLFTAKNGSDLPSGSADRFAIRFHLHPSVQAVIAEDGHSVEIIPRSGIGRRWIFKADGADIHIEESVFLTAIDGPRGTEQIILSGRCSLEPRVSWTFSAKNGA